MRYNRHAEKEGDKKNTNDWILFLRLISAPAKTLRLHHPVLNKTENRLTVSCLAEDLYPRPKIIIHRDRWDRLHFSFSLFHSPSPTYRYMNASNALRFLFTRSPFRFYFNVGNFSLIKKQIYFTILSSSNVFWISRTAHARQFYDVADFTSLRVYDITGCQVKNLFRTRVWLINLQTFVEYQMSIS